MNIQLSTPLLVGERSYSSIKAGVFEVESDRFADVHVLQPMGKRVLPLWKGDAYDAKVEWTSADVVARVNELHAEGKLAQCFDQEAQP